MKEELWAGVTQSGWKPMIWAPMKGALKAMKPRVEGLTSSPMKPEPHRL